MFDKRWQLWLSATACAISVLCLVTWGRDTHFGQRKAPPEKPLPPIDVKWEVTNIRKANVPSSGSKLRAAVNYVGVGRVKVNIDTKSTRFFALDGGTDLSLQVMTQGDVIVRQPVDRQLLYSVPVRNIASSPRTDRVPFEIAEGKRGVVIAEASAVSFDGHTKYGRRVSLYLIADKRKLYVGTSSFIELDIQKLKSDLAAGIINKEKYDSEIKKLLGGGAIESNQPKR